VAGFGLKVAVYQIEEIFQCGVGGEFFWEIWRTFGEGALPAARGIRFESSSGLGGTGGWEGWKLVWWKCESKGRGGD
jgi:hypothetical protein